MNLDLQISLNVRAWTAKRIMTDPQKTVQKSVNTEWVWLMNYQAIKAEFSIEIPESRIIEIGFGLAPQGMPWGARRLVKSSQTLKVYGLGCINARVADHGGLCRISIRQI